MAYKYLALLDYDGTIEKNGNHAEMERLKAIKDDGVLLVVTTGNGFDAALAKPKVTELADILISDVGAVVSRNYGGDLQKRPKEHEGQWAQDCEWSAKLAEGFSRPALRSEIEIPESKGVLNYFLESDFKICYTLPKIDPSVDDIKNIAQAGQRNPGKMLAAMTGISNAQTVQDILYNRITDQQGYRSLVDQITTISKEPDDRIESWLKQAKEKNLFKPVEDGLANAVEPIMQKAGLDMSRVNVMVSKHLGLGDTYVDVIPAEIDKGTSGAYIINQLKKDGLVDDKTIIIAGGDSRNDFEMHSVADYFIAVGNSNEALVEKLRCEGRQECALIHTKGHAAAGLLEAFEQIKEGKVGMPVNENRMASKPVPPPAMTRRMG